MCTPEGRKRMKKKEEEEEEEEKELHASLLRWFPVRCREANPSSRFLCLLFSLPDSRGQKKKKKKKKEFLSIPPCNATPHTKREKRKKTFLIITENKQNQKKNKFLLH
eukprot:TRINITY_DN698_c3_g2_i6.p1 TRINITY_DN698_c3_g2~~TRINITY_DN698_c3_g2_i6.p1  ORF type:complete len:108 (+),score=17.62 TRINITY_DN698_c3_g2_i6:526-849(+)